MSFEVYDHHGKDVIVKSNNKGKHRENCLCYGCKKLDLENRENNCPIANAVYENCVKYDIVTPVWECPVDMFEEKTEV